MAVHSSACDGFTLFQINLLPILFDTGASLSISTYKMGFVGPITLFPEPITLGGMAHGTPITGIGKLNWIFHTCTTNITMHAHFYHVPNA